MVVLLLLLLGGGRLLLLLLLLGGPVHLLAPETSQCLQAGEPCQLAAQVCSLRQNGQACLLPQLRQPLVLLGEGL